MKRFVYCYKNKLIGCFSPKPFVCEVPPSEIIEVVKHDLIHGDEITLKSLKEDELYFLGTHDTETGILESHLEYIQDIGAVASEILNLKAKKVGDEHGKDSES